MHTAAKLLHLAAAVIWLGGMAFVLAALRPVALAQLPPPVRLALMTGVLHRFFLAVWVCIVVLLATGTFMLMAVGMRQAPAGWHVMLGAGILMSVIFSYLYAGPFRRMRAATATADWPAAGRAMAQMHPLVLVNFALGWPAVAGVYLVR